MKVKNRQNGKGGKTTKRTSGPKTRKELRKEKRNAKKQHRRDYYCSKKSVKKKLSASGTKKYSVTGSMAAVKNTTEMPRKINDQPEAHLKEKKVKYEDPIAVRKKREEAAHRELQTAMRETRYQQLNEANEDDERLIKTLEKNLKLNKRKSKSVPKSFAADGLDYLLDICDNEKVKQIAKLEKSLGHSDSELEEDLSCAMVRKGTLLSYVESDHKFARPGTSRDPDTNDDSDSTFGNDKDVTSAFDSDNDFSYYDSDEFDDEENELNIQNTNSTDNVRVTSCIDGVEDSISDYSQKAKKGKHVRFKEEEEEDDDNDPYELSKKNGEKSTKKMKISESDLQDASPHNAKRTKIYDENIDQPGKYVRVYETEGSDGSDNEEGNMSSDVKDSTMEDENGSFWEDIYGRTRDSSGNIVQITKRGSEAYVPPALRAQQSCNDEQTQQRIVRLKRQVKGYLNRLTESNLSSISSEIDNLYSNNSRNDMNSTFTAILMESLVTPVLSLERLTMEHVALVACLHSRVGSDVGAYILQHVVKQYDLLFKGSCDVENKELDNVILIICFLNSFKVVHASLLFDILHCLASRFCPKDVELILLILRTIGFGLRKDDPMRMKSLMVQLQELASANLKQSTESRVKFMLEVLVAVKNNNMSRLPGWDPGPVDNMRKLLRSLLVNRNVSPELNISLQDLLQADERGRWWVVGSAWAGQAPGETEQEVEKTNSECSAQVLALAQQMRMNTDVRRKIFSILLTAQDYIDAFHKLMQLGLKRLQARDLIHVTFECCLQEKVFNPYYSLILQSLCEHDRGFWMTLQCNFWNKFEEIKKMTDCQFNNMVKLLQYLLVQNVMTLGVFKVIDLTELEKPTVRFLRQVLLGILSGDREECRRAFHWVTKSPKHKMFGHKLNVFLHQFVLSKMSSDDPQRIFLQERVDEVFMLQDL